MFKLVKVIHFIGIAMFLGSILGYIVMGIVMGSETDVLKVHLHRQFIQRITWSLTVPGMWLVVLTGVVMTIRGKYGFFKIRWLGIKQVLAIIILANGTFVLAPYVDQLVMLSAQGLSQGTLPEEFPPLKAKEDMFGAVNVLLILVSILLAVFKPTGKKHA
jgi:hypothetical protein